MAPISLILVIGLILVVMYTLEFLLGLHKICGEVFEAPCTAEFGELLICGIIYIILSPLVILINVLVIVSIASLAKRGKKWFDS